jgi:DNA processing protein
MSTDRLHALRLAIVATRFASRAAIMSQLRRQGVSALDGRLESLAAQERAYVDRTAGDLFEAGITGVLFGAPDYPATLGALRAAPPAMFVRGGTGLLSDPGVGICGSRQTGPEGLRATRACSKAATALGFVVTSGYARGVDLESHATALSHDGRTIIVLAEGINRFSVKQGSFGDVWDPSRAAVVSQFAPDARWHAGNAMARNAVIYGTGRCLVVVEAGTTGGTLDAGLRALAARRPVLTLEFGDATPAGNSLLVQRGATPVASRDELVRHLRNLASPAAHADLMLL